MWEEAVEDWEKGRQRWSSFTHCSVTWTETEASCAVLKKLAKVSPEPKLKQVVLYWRSLPKCHLNRNWSKLCCIEEACQSVTWTETEASCAVLKKLAKVSPEPKLKQVVLCWRSLPKCHLNRNWSKLCCIAKEACQSVTWTETEASCAVLKKLVKVLWTKWLPARLFT